MFVRTQTNGDRTYLLLVENARVNGRVVQRVRQRLGRLDKLRESGQLDTILKNLGSVSEHLSVLDAHARGESVATKTAWIGPALIVERLWRECGIADALMEALAPRRFTFPVERAIFLGVLRRLMARDTDRANERWRHEYAIAGADDLKLHHLARANAWLGEPLPALQTGATTASPPRTTKDRIEEALRSHRPNRAGALDLVLVDATSLSLHGTGVTPPRRGGDAHDPRPLSKQMIVGMVLDRDGHPVSTELLPVTSNDGTMLVPVVNRLKQRFGVNEVRIVASLGIVGAKGLEQIEARGWRYIIGVRVRSSKAAQVIASADQTNYRTVSSRRATAADPSPLRVKQISHDGRRYVVCVNPEEAAKDRHDRDEIVTSLTKALGQHDDSLASNNVFRRFLKNQGVRFAIDHTKVSADAQYDGSWILRTNTDLEMDLVAGAYEQMWTLDGIVRSMNAMLETRPMHLQKGEAIHGHVFCSFLALLLQQELDRRLAERGWRLRWADIVRDLDQLTETTITVGSKSYVVRSQVTSALRKAFQAAGVAIPPVVRPG